MHTILYYEWIVTLCVCSSVRLRGSPAWNWERDRLYMDSILDSLVRSRLTYLERQRRASVWVWNWYLNIHVVIWPKSSNILMSRLGFELRTLGQKLSDLPTELFDLLSWDIWSHISNYPSTDSFQTYIIFENSTDHNRDWTRDLPGS